MAGRPRDRLHALQLLILAFTACIVTLVLIHPTKDNHAAPSAVSRRGFTLIELSIVLVIIGLIVGGVLTGQSLIAAAAVRAQVAQIEKFNTAANTFYVKYGYLPGDIPAAPAAQFGFASRGQYAGEGDGNGLLEANYNDCAGCNTGVNLGAGETVMFWVDLSAAHLIDGGFNSASSTACTPTNLTPTSSPSLSAYLPEAKVGGGNYIVVYSGYFQYPKVNYFLISHTALVPAGCGVGGLAGFGLTVSQAYALDKKVDDGLPGSGRVFMDSAQTDGSYSINPAVAVSGSASSCFDNGGVAGNTLNYSVAQNNGSGVNCELSFQLQAGD